MPVGVSDGSGALAGVTVAAAKRRGTSVYQRARTHPVLMRQWFSSVNPNERSYLWGAKCQQAERSNMA